MQLRFQGHLLTGALPCSGKEDSARCEEFSQARLIRYDHLGQGGIRRKDHPRHFLDRQCKSRYPDRHITGRHNRCGLQDIHCPGPGKGQRLPCDSVGIGDRSLDRSQQPGCRTGKSRPGRCLLQRDFQRGHPSGQCQERSCRRLGDR